MRTLARFFVAIVTCFLPLMACGGDSPTVDEGAVRQYSDQWWFSSRLPIDYLFVVDGSSSPEALAIRAKAIRSFAEVVAELEDGDGRWRPVDARAFVVKVGETRMRGPADDLRLGWLENNATREGAARFVQAVREAIEAPSSTPASTDVLLTLRLATSALRRREDAIQEIVIVTARDDSSASREAELSNPNDHLVRYNVLCPEPDELARPTELLKRLGLSTCSSSPGYYESERSWRCIGHRIQRREDGTPECRVRAVFPDAEDEWSTGYPRLPGACERPPGSSEGYACAATLLVGDDARRCEDPEDSCEGCGSGWCVLAPLGRGCAQESIRFVGGAAPPGVGLEVICNVVY